jgi:hypothetical protein
MKNIIIIINVSFCYTKKNRRENLIGYNVSAKVEWKKGKSFYDSNVSISFGLNFYAKIERVIITDINLPFPFFFLFWTKYNLFLPQK